MVAGIFLFLDLWPQGCLTIQPSSSLTDYKSPRLTASIARTSLQGAIVNGGFGINLMPEYTLDALGLQMSQLVHFSFTLVDQCNVPPDGIIENVPVEIQGFIFHLDFVVVRLPKLLGGFPLLIGHPWLRQAKAIHDRGNDQLWICPQGSHPKELTLEGGVDPSATCTFPVEIQGFTFYLDFVVVHLRKVLGGFPLLIGRPRLRYAKACHD